MELSAAQELAKKLMKVHGCGDVPFRWTKSSVEFGVVSYIKGSTRPTKKIRHHNRLIEVDAHMYRLNYMGLSSPLVEANEQAVVENVILHEIAHMLDVKRRGYSCHDEFWQMLAQSVGSDGIRCFDPFSVKAPVNVQQRKYVAVCPSCVHETFSNQMWPRNRVCTKCARIHPGQPNKYKLSQEVNPAHEAGAESRLLARRASKAEATRRCRAKQAASFSQ